MPKRLVDILAGKDSLADKLRKRRNAIESGDATGGDAFKEPTPPMTHFDHTKPIKPPRFIKK